MLYSHTNKLVRFYPGVDGLKTGYTKSAGFCITATANKNDMRVITVVMGEPDTKTRNSEVTSIFDYVYAQYALEKIVSKDDVLKSVDIEKSKNESVEIVPMEDVNNLYNKTESKPNITYDIEVNNLKAPIHKGDVVGKLTLKENDQIIKEVPLTVKQDYELANIFELYYRYLKNMITMGA